MSNQRQTFRARVASASDTVNAPLPQGDNCQHGFMCVTTSGDITVLTDLDAVVTFKTVPLNTVVPVRIRRINATNTTATGLLYLENPIF